MGLTAIKVPQAIENLFAIEDNESISSKMTAQTKLKDKREEVLPLQLMAFLLSISSILQSKQTILEETISNLNSYF